MGWGGLPDRGRLSRDEYAREREAFVERHRASARRWLDWLELAGLVSHTPQQDEEGVWWRTIIELHPVPEIERELLEAAVARRAGWPGRERRRRARGRRRDLTAILRRARLTRTERRARGVQRRQRLAACAERQRVREAVADSLERAAKTHMSHPFGASTTSRITSANVCENSTFDRGLTGAHTRRFNVAVPLRTQPTGGEEGGTQSGEDVRWAVYREVMSERFARAEEQWAAQVAASARRLEELLDWPVGRSCPRWRLIECWTVSAHGSWMAAAGGFRLAFWCEQREHHGARLERALARYSRYAQARPPGWPQSPIAALARFLTSHTPPQDGPEHGMAYDIQRFNELTKQMSAYAHYTRPTHLDLASRRAARRQRLDELAAQVNQRLRFRTPDTGPLALLRRASGLLDSQHPNHQAAGRAMYARAARAQQLAERDRRLLAAQHPGNSDGRYRAACAHAKRWGLTPPPRRSPAADQSSGGGRVPKDPQQS